MSIFDRIDRMTSRAVDQQFADAFVCTPMRSTPNGRPEPDPDRPEWGGVGVLTETAGNVPVDIGARNRSHELRTLVTGAAYELSVDRARHPAADLVRQRDRFVISGREFSVLEMRADGMSRIVFALAEA